MHKKISILLMLLISILLINCHSYNSIGNIRNSEYKQVNEANPLKGFVPFAGENNAIPSSMEFFSMPMNAIEKQRNVFDFTDFENQLSEISARGHQAIFRIYLDYPEMENGTPDFFWDDGIEKLYYTNPDTGNKFFFPDYTNQKCIDHLCDFISKMGRKYDGDSRIAFIFCGLVGHWGEWHNYYYTLTGDSEHLPNDAQQEQIYKAFAENFSKTFTLTRYPSTPSLLKFQNIGFHDDSFTEDTIDDKKDWYFMSRLKKSKMAERWKTAPIGGEFRPENQLPFLNEKKYAPYYQDYDECVNETHCSWLLYDTAFYPARTEMQREKAWQASKKLGYDLFCSDVKYNVTSQKIELHIEITNIGTAPFYYNWKPVVEIINGEDTLKIFKNPFSNWNLPSIFPEQSENFSASLDISELKEMDLSSCKIILGIPNPDEKGMPLKFANKTLNQDKKGFITLVTKLQ